MMYVRLIVAIFDSPVTSALETGTYLRISCGVAVPHNSGYSEESRHAIYIRSDGRHFDFFVGVALKVVMLQTTEKMRL